MIGQPQVYDALSRMGIPFDYYEHPEAPTIEIAAQFYRGEGTTLCKNLFFRNHKGNRHYLVIMDSRYPMDIHDMEHRLHQGKLSFASPERMMRYLGGQKLQMFAVMLWCDSRMPFGMPVEPLEKSSAAGYIRSVPCFGDTVRMRS